MQIYASSPAIQYCLTKLLDCFNIDLNKVQHLFKTENSLVECLKECSNQFN